MAYGGKAMSKNMLGIQVGSANKQYTLTITASDITSTDDRFTMNDLSFGDNYKPISSLFKSSDGKVITRKKIKYEKKISNQTLPKLACQIYEDKLESLTEEEKASFPICQYTPNGEIIRGIYADVEEFRKHRNTIEYLWFNYGDGKTFVFYCWNIFSTIIFIRECLKRFGNQGDCFELTYRDKEKKEKIVEVSNTNILTAEYQNPYTHILLSARNIVFRGAPGTGKTFLAQQIAADLISSGRTDDIEKLTRDEIKQMGFVQFHPSYDYADFVEGLRPTSTGAEVGFELEPGVFKAFCEIAGKPTINEIDNFEQSWEKFVDKMDEEQEIEVAPGYKYQPSESWETMGGIMRTSDKGYNQYINKGQLYKVYRGLPGVPKGGHDNFRKKVIQYMKGSLGLLDYKAGEGINDKPYVFVIDEINRGEISKIFGELFFSIDPGYRGEKGGVLTQYSNLHDKPNEKFFIPKNVYIIGTMNDIDRSVDTFDFAMRRRFTFLEITAEESAQNMDLPLSVYEQMRRINDSIVEKGGLTTDYQIGASYFIDLNEPETDESNAPLWNNKFFPLLNDYFRGEHKATDKLLAIKKDYFNVED